MSELVCFPGVVCNSTFDKFACWPDGLPNTTVGVACPWYLPWHSEGKIYITVDLKMNLTKPVYDPYYAPKPSTNIISIENKVS